MTEDELRELQELAHKLEELTRHPGWPVLVDYAHFGDGMQQSRQKYLLGGLCKTPEEYQKYVGWVSGSQSVLDIPKMVAGLRDKYSVTEAGESADDV